MTVWGYRRLSCITLVSELARRDGADGCRKTTELGPALPKTDDVSDGPSASHPCIVSASLNTS